MELKMMTANIGIRRSKMLVFLKGIKALTACFCLMLAVCSFLQAKEWHGIVPLHSTRADVERILGVPEKPGGATYSLSNGYVYISFSDGPCIGAHGGWNVPRETVINITEIFFDPKPEVANLKIDESKYKKVRDQDYLSVVYYKDEEEGISIEVNMDTGLVNGITYLPAAKDNYLRCPAPAENSDDGIEDSRKFDEYSNLSFDEEKKHLSDFATQLQADPNAKGYIIAYAGRIAHAGEAQARADRAKNYLINERGINARRIVTIDGGYREALTVDLWIRPNGWRAPKASPTVDPSKAQIIKDSSTKNSNCHSTRPRYK
jgi:hypothetical protein